MDHESEINELLLSLLFQGPLSHKIKIQYCLSCPTTFLKLK